MEGACKIVMDAVSNISIIRPDVLSGVSCTNPARDLDFLCQP